LRVSDAEGKVIIVIWIVINLEFIGACGNRASWGVGAAEKMRLSVEWQVVAGSN
jgi:hypothetical protein